MLTPLVFRPLYRRYIWGGRGFAAVFGRDLPPGDDYAESWELVDRGADQSIVAEGPWSGRSLGELVREHGDAVLGSHVGERFPLLFKFLDACRDLSVQVHPDDARAARLSQPDLGKTEAWYVVAARPGSRIYAGLQPGVGPRDLAAAINAGRCDTVLHAFEPSPGDCVFIPAGTIHAIGAGLLVAEIQQSSDVTYRLHDWNRTGPDGRPRPLHIEAGLEAVTQTGPVGPVTPAATSDGDVSRLVDCPYFRLDEVSPRGHWDVGGDGRWHFLAVLTGSVSCDDRWGLPPLGPGGCVLMPAAIGRQPLRTAPAGGQACRLLRVCLP
jgi:mannose-6-phosphate isomerase